MGRQFMQLQAYSFDRILRLDLTPEQRIRLCGEAYEKAAKLPLLKAEQYNVRLKIACLQIQDKVDEAQLREAFNKSAQLAMDLFLARQDYIKIVETILTKEQLTSLRSQPPTRRPAPRQMMRQPPGPPHPGPVQPPKPPQPPQPPKVE